MQLVLYPDPRLNRRARPIEHIDREVREKVANMFEIMYEECGVGLAAPQVGGNARVFIVNTTGEPDPDSEFVYINPEISRPEGEVERVRDEEGCLSIPSVKGKVTRDQVVRVKAFDLKAQTFEEQVEDLHARVVQHENDHWDGILLVSHLGLTDRLQAAKHLKKLEKEYKGQREAEV